MTSSVSSTVREHEGAQCQLMDLNVTYLQASVQRATVSASSSVSSADDLI